jgi:glycosyltransferase involved in cell wall biosynthesis
MNQNNKKKVLIVTDNIVSKTGFGRAAKLYIEYLYKLNKYDLVHLAIGTTNAAPSEMMRFPWRTIPSVNISQLENIKRQNDPKNHEGIDRMAGYGAFVLDDVVKTEKPQVVLLVQDVWSFDVHINKKWFQTLNPVLWVTLDSLPILPKAVEIAPKVKNYWSWADFATKAMHKLGYAQVRTVRGPVDTKSFSRLNNEKKKQLRFENNIPENTFIIGDVFRNQLRKSVPNMLEGFAMFKKECPNAKLLFHTSWAEGWDIPRFMKQFNVEEQDVLTTYICKNCKKYQIKPFTGHDLDCPHCKAQKSQVTTNPAIGVSEKQLNEIYNLMDVFLHAITSGGQEIPVQEAKLTELITLVTNYSCGEDSCQPEAHSFALDWKSYYEPGTQFIKSSTYPSSIYKQLMKVYTMSPKDRLQMGFYARKWVIDNFSVEVIGKILENHIDNSPIIDESVFDFKDEQKDPTYNIPDIHDNVKWLLDMYQNILKMKDVDENNDGVKHWISQLSNGVPRKDIENFFRKTAWEENQKAGVGQVSFESLLNKDDKKRVIVVLPESTGDVLLVTSLFKSIRERYPKPEWAFYFSCKRQFKDIIDGNPYIDKWIEYNPMMDNLLWLEGSSSHNGYFNIAYLPYIKTQRMLGYLHSGQDKIDFELQK